MRVKGRLTVGVGCSLSEGEVTNVKVVNLRLVV